MSASQQNSRIVFFSLCPLGVAIMSCAEPKTEGASIAFQISPGVTISTASYWVIAPDGKVTTGTVAVGSSANVRVIISGLPAATGYQLIVSGLASNGITGCSGSTTFNAPTPSTGVAVTLMCAGPPAPGQALVTATVNICPVIDGVSASPSSVAVGSSMALRSPRTIPIPGRRRLTYAWSADGGTLTGGTAATATFTCAQPGTFNISVAASDGDANCGRLRPSPSPARSSEKMISSKIGTSMSDTLLVAVGTSGIVGLALAAVLATAARRRPPPWPTPASGMANAGQSATGALSVALVVPPNFQINTISYQLTTAPASARPAA